METVVGVEGSEETKVEDGVSGDAGSELMSSKHISDADPDPDPVVYKLVRVDGDGRLIPATDDEVLVVEDMLKDEKAKHLTLDSRQPRHSSKTERCSLETTQLPLEESLNIQLDNAAYQGKENVQLAETVNELALPLNRNDIRHSWNIASSGRGGLFENGSSNPDFSKLRGEICLDNLSVKELHETFRATFGRETSVKDKQWLKRRISMALTNSCDFSTSSFIIKDNKVAKKGKVAHIRTGAASTGSVVGVTKETVGGLLNGFGYQSKSHSNFDNEKEPSTSMDQDPKTDDPNLESRAAKRIRKPTKRYIEEISEVESGDSSGRLISTVKTSEHEYCSVQARIRPVKNFWSIGRPVVTRHDSLGGSGVKVPYVSRIRRSQPRENFMPLMKLQQNGIATETRMLKNGIGEPEPLPEDETGEVPKARLLSGCVQRPLFSPPEERKRHPERNAMELERHIELNRIDSFEDNSDDNIVSTPSCGIRRKHHRPWSLTEVVKLVEGVAQYGAGRWSEIKRLAFSTYSYRTSVDLKDKWRNLLKASLVQLHEEKGNTRKHASIPIPAPILMRVRELAEMQEQVAPKLPPNKFTGNTVPSGRNDRNVVEARSGFL